MLLLQYKRNKAMVMSLKEEEGQNTTIVTLEVILSYSPGLRDIPSRK